MGSGITLGRMGVAQVVGPALDGAARGGSGSVRGSSLRAASCAALGRRLRSLLHSAWSIGRPLRLAAGEPSPLPAHASLCSADSPWGISLPKAWRGCAVSAGGDWLL